MTMVCWSEVRYEISLNGGLIQALPLLRLANSQRVRRGAEVSERNEPTPRADAEALTHTQRTNGL